MLDKDEVEAQLSGLLLHQGVDAVHALAGYVVVKEHHVAVEVLGPLPDGVHIFPASHGVVAHNGLLGEQRKVLDGLLRVVGADHVVPHGGVHIQHDVDAPAVLHPGGEVGVIHGRGSPQEGPVAGLALEGLILLLIGLAHQLDDLPVGFGEIVLLAVDGGPGVQAVQGFSNPRQGGVGSLEDVPLLQLDQVLLVHMLGPLEQGVPVVLHAVLLLNEGDGVFQLPSGIGVGAGLVVDHGHGHRLVGQLDAAALEHGGGLRGVAGHIGGQEGLAENGESVVDGNAGLRRAAGADVRRQAVGLGHIDIIRLDMLVDIADDEFRQGLQRDGNQILEARHEQRGQHLIHGHHPVGEGAAAKAPVVGQHQSDLLGQALHDGVHIHVGDAQLIAPVALEQPVDEHEGAKVGAHPAVLPEALQAGDGGGAHHHRHAAQILQPLAVVIEGVLHAAPFPVFGNAGLVVIAGAEAAHTVFRLPQGVKALQLFVDGFDQLVSCFHITCLPECS